MLQGEQIGSSFKRGNIRIPWVYTDKLESKSRVMRDTEIHFLPVNDGLEALAYGG